MDPFQYGSRKGHSTVLALAELLHLWLLNLDKPGTVIRSLMIDYRKAFDRVDHNTLMGKIQNLGVPEFLHQWIYSFLCESNE